MPPLEIGGEILDQLFLLWGCGKNDEGEKVTAFGSPTE